jgi:hypothetical protein
MSNTDLHIATNHIPESEVPNNIKTISNSMQYSPVHWIEAKWEEKEKTKYIYTIYISSFYWAKTMNYSPMRKDFHYFDIQAMKSTYSLISIDHCSCGKSVILFNLQVPTGNN